jgi:hypothetical protein
MLGLSHFNFTVRLTAQKYMSTLTLRVPDDLDKALQRQSAALGISKSDLARKALKRAICGSQNSELCEPSWLRARRLAESIPMKMFSRPLRRSEDRT